MKITEKEEKEVLERYGVMSNKKLAWKLGIDRDRLRNIAKQLGIWSAPLDLVTLAKFIDPEELALDYKSNTMEECAAIYNVPETVIAHILRVNNIRKSDKKTNKLGIFNKPKGWNPITNSVRDSPMDARLKELDIIQTYKTYRHEHGTKDKFNFQIHGFICD